MVRQGLQNVRNAEVSTFIEQERTEFIAAELATMAEEEDMVGVLGRVEEEGQAGDMDRVEEEDQVAEVDKVEEEDRDAEVDRAGEEEVQDNP